MKLTDFYKKIISKEPYNDMGVFFLNYESFEEIPLISRYSRLETLKSSMADDNVSDFLVGLTFFILNSIKALSSTLKNNDIFFAVTFTDFEIFEVQGVIIPNIFIYPKPASAGFLKKYKAIISMQARARWKKQKVIFQDVI